MSLQVSLNIIFIVGFAVNFLAGSFSALAVANNWKCNEELSQRKRKVLAATAFSCFMMFSYYLSSFVACITNDKLLVEPLMQTWTPYMWFFLFFAGGATAFALAKFLRFFDNLTWVFVLSTAVGFGFLGFASLASGVAALESVRWVAFSLSAVSFLVGLTLFLFADAFYVKGQNAVAEPPIKCERAIRWFIRIWVTITWLLVLVAWMLGTQGIKDIATSNLVFEQAAYLVVLTLALVAPGIILVSAYSPSMDTAAKVAAGVARRSSTLLSSY